MFFSVDRQSEIGDQKLESWTLGNVEDCRVFFEIPYDVYDSFVCFPKCDALFQVLHAFDKIMIF